MDREREFFNCGCHTEGIILDDLGEDTDNEICLAMWSYGQEGGKLPFAERLRWGWNILWKGIPWADAVVLCPKEAKRLAEAILRRVK